MTKPLFFALIFTSYFFSSAQTDENAAIQSIVESFFASFHDQDSLGMKRYVLGNIEMHSTGKNRAGVMGFQQSKVEDFYKSIVSIPDSIKFEEKLLDWDIRIDRNMATAWVGYEFYLNGKLSHVGVNSFQLVKLEEDWKIVYIMDTRER